MNVNDKLCSFKLLKLKWIKVKSEIIICLYILYDILYGRNIYFNKFIFMFKFYWKVGDCIINVL